MNIKIAICDDELMICTQLENILQNILNKKDIFYTIEVFTSSEYLCKQLYTDNYDLIFLDIQIPKINGIEVGKYIREEHHNMRTQIAYISSKMDYAMQLFDSQPINFLIKPLDERKVLRVIDQYMKIAKQDSEIFEYKKRTDYYKIPLSEILYFENEKRKVIIHRNDGNDEFYDSMEKVYEKVKKHKFLYIHKSFIVNYNFIKKISYDQIQLMDDNILPISQSRRSAIKSMYMKIRQGEKE